MIFVLHSMQFSNSIVLVQYLVTCWPFAVSLNDCSFEQIIGVFLASSVTLIGWINSGSLVLLGVRLGAHNGDGKYMSLRKRGVIVQYGFSDKRVAQCDMGKANKGWLNMI